MKSLSSASNNVLVPQTADTISLHQLVSRLMNSFIPLAVAKNSFIINDVGSDFYLTADEQVLSVVVSSLLTNAVNSSENVCIRIEAIKTGQGVQIRVRHNGASYYSTVANSFSQAMEAARILGGNINIHNRCNEGTVTTFYFAA